MSNEFFTASSVPVNGAPGSAATIRAEFAQIVAAFDKMPVMAGNANELVVVNGTGTALEASAVTLTEVLTSDNTRTLTNKTLSWSGNVWNGFGNAATRNAGTGAGEVLLLNEPAKLPIMDGSNLTNLNLSSLGILPINQGGTGAITLNAAQTALGIDLKADILNASLQGTPIAPTPAPADSSGRLATTKFVSDAVAAASFAAGSLVAGSALPLADGVAAAGVSPSVSHQDHVHPTDTTLMPKAGGTFTGTVSGVTPTGGDNTTKLATTAFVTTHHSSVALPISQITGLQTALDSKANAPIAITDVTTLQATLNTKANLANPTFSGTVTLPAISGSIDSSNKAATTAFVQAVVATAGGADVSSDLPSIKMNGTAAVGVSPDASRVDHVHPTDTTLMPKAGGTFTGAITLPTGGTGLNAATVNQVNDKMTTHEGAVDPHPQYALEVSPVFTGVPEAPTAAAGTNTTQIATTAFVRSNDTRGKHTISIPAGALRPRATGGCSPLAVTAGATDQPDVPYLAFATTPAQYAGIVIAMPKGWNEGVVTASFQWRRESGTSAANVIWGVRARAVSNGDTPAAAFGSKALVTAAANEAAAVNFSLSGETGDCTIGGTPVEGDLVFFEFFREADSVSPADTLGVAAWLTSVKLHYTTDANTDA